MGVFDIYSKHKRLQEKSGQPDVYTYDNIPLTFRPQVVHIWNDTIGLYDYHNRHLKPSIIWESIHGILCREYGVFTLGREDRNPYDNCCRFLLEESDIDRVLSLIEVSFKHIDTVCRKYDTYIKHRANIKQNPDNAINELNIRFR